MLSLWSAGASAAQVGSTVTTGAGGQFTLHFNCPAAGTLMFVIATGGNAGSGANSHISLASALGACGSMPASIVVNELTSVAAAYAFSGLAPPAGSSAPGFEGNATGLANAFAVDSKLVVASTGTFSTSGHESNQSAVQQALDTVANSMAACDNSNNTAGTSAACAELFSCASANATFVATGQPCTGGTSTATSDTLSAALAITQNAGLVSSAGVFDVASSSTAFSPALSAAPNDFTLPLIFPVKNFGPLAVDGFGNIWVLSVNQDSNSTPHTLSVAEFDATGFEVSPATGWTSGGISNLDTTDTTNMAIDPQNNVWVGGSSSNIAEINSQGGGVAPSQGWIAGVGPGKTAGVAIDSSGNAWFADGNSGDIFEMGAAGNNLSGNNGYGASVCDCTGIAADKSGDVWIIGVGAQPGIAKVNPSGVQGTHQEPPGLYAGHFSFVAIAGDAAGNLWITDQPQHGVWQFTPSGASGTFSAAPFVNTAGGGTIPKGIAVDGAGHKWIANQSGGSPTLSSITELSADGTLNLSPATGFGSGSIGGAYSIAIDQSGNVWASDGGSNVIQFVGAAAPTRNPIASAVDAGNFSP